MKEEHGIVLTLLADEHLAVGSLIVMEFQARAPAVSAPAPTDHELGERAIQLRSLGPVPLRAARLAQHPARPARRDLVMPQAATHRVHGPATPLGV